MADKRISQLVDRGTVANSDVVPIVVSGASTTNKATISSIQTFMQGNLDLGVTSVGLSMPSAFTVTGSPVTSSGNISVVGAGTVSQYIRGDGSLADFPQGGGGGSSVNYYLNGSVSQGTIGGVAYLEMNKTPILGAGTDFTINADGYIASFITDAGDPALLEIPAGNWNFETYLQASSAGGTPSFYIELYKVNSGGTATLIASNSATPELIAFGTSTTPYFSALAVPTTTLALTDRLALRYYVTHSGRTITLHTENNTLCQIITTFTTGLTALNGLTAQVQNFATGTSGTDFAISSSTSTHTFNLPTASSSNRGALSSADWTTFNGKQNALNGTGFVKISGTTISYDNSTYLTTGTAASTYVPYTGAAANVDLGVYNLTASAVNVNGSGSNAGVINLESNAIFPLVNGYGTIGSGTTNQFNFYQTTGAGVFRGAIFSLNSITPSATRTFTLPDADGTLALTSSLGSYLPLAGGTLTGALNGTSASFNTTNAITLTASDSRIRGGDTAGRLLLANSGTTTYGIFHGSSHATLPNAIQFYNDNTLSLTLASTGAATFSSSVTVSGSFQSSGTTPYWQFQSTGAGGTGYIGFGASLISGAAATDFILRSDNALKFAIGNSATMTLTSTGNVGIGTSTPDVTGFGWKVLTIKGGTGSGEAGVIELQNTVSVSNDQNLGIIAFLDGTSRNAQISVRRESSTSTAHMDFWTNAGAGLVERMRITADGYTRLSSSSGGIQFNGDTAAANALDDYEEGTWTPTTNGDATGAFSTAYGEYTKIGNFVFFRAIVTISTNFTSSSIAGLPFTVGGNATASSLYGGMLVFNSVNSDLSCSPSIGSTIISIYAGSATSSNTAPTTSMSTLRISGAYRV